MTEVTYTDPAALGLTYQEDMVGGLAEVIEVVPGSASERMAVQPGWLIERVDGEEMRSRPFAAVSAALKNPRRPLRVQFALPAQSVSSGSAVGQNAQNATLGGGWLYDFAMALPDGSTAVVSVAAQDAARSAEDLMRLLFAQHGTVGLPPHAVQFVLVRQLATVGLRGTKLTGETAETLVPANMAIATLQKRVNGGEALAVRLEPQDSWEPKGAVEGGVSYDAAGAPSKAAGKPCVSGSGAWPGDDDAFELEF